MNDLRDKDLKFRQTFRIFMAQNMHDFKWHELKKMMEQEIEVIDIDEWQRERTATHKPNQTKAHYSSRTGSDNDE